MLKAGVLQRLSLAAGAVAVQCCVVQKALIATAAELWLLTWASPMFLEFPEKLKVSPNEKSSLQLPVIIVMLTLEKARTKV